MRRIEYNIIDRIFRVVILIILCAALAGFTMLLVPLL